MNKNKLEDFLKELSELEEKYGIFVSADYEEHIEYDWNEEPYIFGCSAHIIYLDSEGNEIPADNI